MTRADVTITGMGVVSPIGLGPAACWDSLMHGRAAARPVTSFSTAELPRHVACEIGSLPDAEAPWDHRPCGGGRCTQLMLLAARDALNDAGLAPADLHGRRVAVIVGTTMGEFEFVEAAYNDLDPAPPPDDAFTRAVDNAPGRLSTRLAAALAADGYRADLYGACAAGNMALIHGMMLLASGEADLVVAGGADAFSRFAFVGFMRNRVMARQHCRPFDQDRDGLLLGEAAAMFVLERAGAARGRRRYASLVGAGLGCDAYNPTCPRPDGRGITRVIRDALQQAGLTPGDVQYVSAHGTGTPRNDDAEWQALDDSFPDGVPFSSTKALTGHTMGAAGAIEAAACVLALRHQRLIPNWNLQTPARSGPACPVREPDAATLDHVMNLSFGFGGYNSCLVLRHGGA